MTKHLPDFHRVDELKNFAANNLFRLVFRSRVLGSTQLVSHILGNRVSERGTITAEQVRLDIGVRIQL